MNTDLQQIRIGDLRLDVERHTVTRGSNAIDMSGLSFRLLQVLADHWPETVSRRELAKRVWGDIVVSDETLRQRIRLLRRSLGESEYIAAVKGIGYRLTRSVGVATPSGRRRNYSIAASFAVIGVFAYVMLSGDLAYDLVHEVRHAIWH